MAVANVPQRSLIGGRDDLPVKTSEYNKALPGLLKKFDSALSATRLVDIAGNYDCQPAHCPVRHTHVFPLNLESALTMYRRLGTTDCIPMPTAST